MDKTTLNEHGILTQRTKNILIKIIEQGIHIVIASGRPLCALPSDVVSIDGLEYAITGNGSSVYELASQKRLFGFYMEESVVLQLLDLFRNYPIALEGFQNGLAYADQTYVEFPEKYGANSLKSIKYVQQTRIPIPDITSFLYENRTTLEGMNAIIPNADLKLEIRNFASQIPNLYITSSIPRYLEFAHKDVSKASGIQFLQNYLKIHSDQIAAFGDGENDLEMIQHAGFGVAMADGVPILKQAADQIAPPCSEDGVAQILEKLFKNNSITF